MIVNPVKRIIYFRCEQENKYNNSKLLYLLFAATLAAIHHALETTSKKRYQTQVCTKSTTTKPNFKQRHLTWSAVIHACDLVTLVS